MRGIAAVLSAVAMLFAFSLPTAFASSTRPVLGSKHAFPNGKGFGSAKPRTVFLGGDPTGEVKSIIWHNWGAPRTVGYGQGWCAGRSVAAGHPCSAALHLSGLGTCHGRRAYTELAFYFRKGGRWMAGTKLNACTGQFQP